MQRRQRALFTALAVVVFVWSAVGVEAQTGNTWISGGPEHTHIVVGPDGQTYVGVWVEAPEIARTTDRAPMAVSLVIDTSGSMSGAKIEHARLAATSLIETLGSGDIVSVYGFSNEVVEIMPPTILNANARSMMMQRIRGLVAGGGTNMYDGIQVASTRLSQASGGHRIRRMIVISDGQANIGPSDPVTLGNLAGQATEWGTQVTAIGVGLDYSEQTLGALAVRSSGRLYHLEHPHQMANILREELQLLATTVAVNTYIEIIPAPGVVILEGLSLGAQLENGRLRLPVGAMYGGQRRELLFRARVDASQVGEKPLAQAQLFYQEPGAHLTHSTRAQGGAQHAQELSLRYHVTRDAAQASRSVNASVVAMVANHEATQAQFRAAELLNRGESQAAAQTLAAAEADLRERAEQAPESEVREQLMERSSRMRQAQRRATEATSAPAARSGSLEMMDDAYHHSGF